MSTPPSVEAPPARAWWQSPVVTAAALLLLVALGGWLRWQALTRVQPHVDEFTTLWAAERIQESGVPRLPSGVLYTRGWLHTYLTAGALSISDARAAADEAGTLAPLYLAGRLPSLVIGLATILLIYWVGARGWNRGVGLLAAVGLALLPEAVVWSSRARFYGLLQFLALLLFWQTWEWVRAEPKEAAPRPAREWRWALGWAALVTLALFTQEQTLLLLPGLLLAILLWRGPRWMARAPRVVAFGLVAAAAAARYGLEIWGQPGYFETIQASRPYLGLVFDVQGAWKIYSPLFVAPERLPWTLGALVGLGWSFYTLARRRSLSLLSFDEQSTLYYGLNLLAPLAAIFLLVGTSWRDTRYLLFVQPLWLLLGAAGIARLVETLVRPTRLRSVWQIGAGLLVALALGALLLQPARAATLKQEEGYARVLEQVAELRQPGDAVLSPQPPACALVLGPCNGYAIQRGYEEYVLESGGKLIDRWSGAPLINTTAALSATVATAPTTWFVSDGFRLATRYEADYLRFLLSHFDPVIEELGVTALRSTGLRDTPALDVTMPLSAPLAFGPISLVNARRNQDVGAGTPLVVDLEWVAVEPVTEQINTSVRLVNATGKVVAQSDGPPARGVIPTTLFFDTPLPDTKVLTLPVDLPTMRYRIDVAAYAVGAAAPDGAPEVTPVGEPEPVGWFLNAANPAPPGPPLGEWQNGMRLLGGVVEPSTPAPGERLTVTLTWITADATARPLTAFVHLLDGSGAIVAQSDKQPEDGFFPTTAWAGAEPVTDVFVLGVPAGFDPAGTWRLVTGWYDVATGARVPTGSGKTELLLAPPE